MGYPQELKYFMWAYQVHFIISCQIESENIFDKLDRGLTSKVFLLGFDDNYQHINFEPESVDYLKPAFDDLKALIKEEFDNHPNGQMFYSGPGVQERMDRRLLEESRRLAIENALNNSIDGTNYIFFVSKVMRLQENNIYVALRLNKQVFESHLHLKARFFEERFPIYRSLLETTVNAFLADCQKQLYFPDPGYDHGNGKSWDEILRDAARQLTYTFSSKGEAFKGLHGLFDACNSISIHKYEGKENLGTLILTHKDHLSINYTLRLDEPFNLNEYRKARKMLQLAKGDIGVICNSHQVLGLGTVKTDYDSSTESIFYVKFKGVHCWEVWHDAKPILVMNYGVPQFISEVINKAVFYSDCRRIFKEINDIQIQNLYQLSVGTTSQKNGALLIISDDAAGEAERLKNQCLRIKPQKLDLDLLASLTAIDGGVLVDREGIAYAYGVILDGIVKTGGDASRGSRYNSAIRYIEYKGKESKTLIVVVSEDGMVDVIPQLRPQIYRAEIKSVIEILKEQKANLNTATFSKAMDWLISRRFYLTIEQTELINSIKNEIINRPLTTEVRIMYDDIHPNPDLDDSYFLD